MIARPQPPSILDRVVTQLGRVLVVGQAPNEAALDAALRAALGRTPPPPGRAPVPVANERARVRQAITTNGLVVADWEARLRAQVT